MLTRRRFTSFLGGAAASVLAQPARKPNLVFFLADDMGYGDIGPFGAPDIRTPNLDRLARQGVRFTHNYSNGPVCTPTRAALMTGRYQQRTGLEWALVPADKGKGLQTTHPAMPRMLKPAGYRTALCGKWHLGMEPEYSPMAHGFDEFFGILSGNVDMYSHRYRTGFADLWENDKPVEKSGYLTDLIAERAAGFVERNARDPFFLYVAFNAVHWPFQRPDRPDVRNEKTWYDGTRADYGTMVESMDAGIGRVLKAIEASGTADNTLVVFTDDNGGERLSRNQPLFHRKGTLWEGGIRVPAIARWPGRMPQGKTCEYPVTTMDWTATMLSAAGATSSTGRPLDGLDIAPIARGSAPGPDRTLFWRIQRPARHQRAARRGKWKYIRDGDVEMLFDVVADPGEKVDLAYSHPAMVSDLRAAVVKWEADVDQVPPPFSVR